MKNKLLVSLIMIFAILFFSSGKINMGSSTVYFNDVIVNGMTYRVFSTENANGGSTVVNLTKDALEVQALKLEIKQRELEIKKLQLGK